MSMQIVEKADAMFGKMSYELAVPEVKTEKEFYDLAYDIAGLENVDRIECKGYFDMDTHENFATFKTRDDFRKNLSDVKKIEADSITIFFTGKDGLSRTKVAKGRVTHLYMTGKEPFINSVIALLKKKFSS